MKAKNFFVFTYGVMIFFGSMSVSASILEDERTHPLIQTFCEEKHWRNPKLIGACLSNQIDSLARLENYLESEWGDAPQNHPVFNIFEDSLKKSSVVVSGESWADWQMVKYRFKNSLQDWLKAQGKTDPVLNSYL